MLVKCCFHFLDGACVELAPLLVEMAKVVTNFYLLVTDWLLLDLLVVWFVECVAYVLADLFERALSYLE